MLVTNLNAVTLNIDKIESYLLEGSETSLGFPEGKIIERIHNARERNSKVIEIAKTNFKKEFGRLFCQICGFDFKEMYGELGEDFKEGHHTIPVSQMPLDYFTKPEEIAMLCSNCHRMVHKRRPWLTMDKLSEIKRHPSV